MAEKAAEFFKLVETKIATKSFEGARSILLSSYAQILLGDEKISYLKG